MTPNERIEARLWDAANELRANSRLRASEYSTPVLGLVFLRYADHRFQTAQEEVEGADTGRRKIGAADYQARGVRRPLLSLGTGAGDAEFLPLLFC